MTILRRWFGMQIRDDNDWWCWLVIGGAFAGGSLMLWLPLLLMS
jgi:hypothetical protein